MNDFELKIANANLNFSLYDKNQDDDFSQLLFYSYGCNTKRGPRTKNYIFTIIGFTNLVSLCKV